MEQSSSHTPQLDLFSAPAANPEPEPADPSIDAALTLYENLSGIDPDNLTPKEALETLYRLRKDLS